MYLVPADRIWRSFAAGLCGNAAHTGIMVVKGWMGWLPAFNPYQDLQASLSTWLGSTVHPAVPWAMSFVNGTLVLGVLFRASYHLLPGRGGATKGFVFGVLGWLAMGLLFFPLLGRGLFAERLGLGARPAAFALVMVLAYSVFMGIAYSMLHRTVRVSPSGPQTRRELTGKRHIGQHRKMI